MAEVLILTLVFPPDSVSTAHIMGELARDLESAGNRVTVLTTSPHYNRDVEAERLQPIRNRWGPFLKRSVFHGIPVFHTLMPRKGTRLLPRLLGWSGFHLISLLAGMTVVPRPDVILAPSPPLTIGLCAWLLGKFHRAPFIYNVQEVYPDIAVRMGILRRRRVIAFLYRLERFVYDRAGRIAVIAPRMRQMLMAKGVPPEKIETIPNFVDVDDLSPLPKDNDFSREQGIHDRFVVSYAGNMGPAQGLESFVDAAGLLRDEPGIHFLMLGNGSLAESLRERVARLGLRNFSFLPYQPTSRMPQIYAASDLCLVPLAAETGCDAVPSKVYRIMACGRPVLASTESDSDLGHLVESAGCGGVVPPGDTPALAAAIREASIHREEWRRRGLAGREHVVAHYARLVVTRRYHDLIREMAGGGRSGGS